MNFPENHLLSAELNPDSERHDNPECHGYAPDVEEAILFNMLFENEGKTLYVDHSLGEPISDTNFFTEESLGKNGSGQMRYDENDFECQPAFLALKAEISKIINRRTKPEERMRACEWVFIPNLENEDGISMELCCQALQIRPQLIRVRTQYELYKNGVVFDCPLPFLSVKLPEYFALEILGIFTDEIAVTAAEIIWSYPGIRADRLPALLEDSIGREALSEMLLAMERRGIISISGGHWFFTGRNPELMKQSACFHWTKIQGL